MIDAAGGDFNPRAPCGARPIICAFRVNYKRFQSTRPVWGATRKWPIACCQGSISIHAPRVGRDVHPLRRRAGGRHFNPRAPCGARRTVMKTDLLQSNFNPRAPCGARPLWPDFSRKMLTFQSTRPVWGATSICLLPAKLRNISIHAPRVGRDDGLRRQRRCDAISIHAPRVGRDCA